MATPVNIIGDASSIRVKVTKFGQLVTAPIQYSRPSAKELTDIGVPVNFIEPEAGSSIVITDILVFADKSVSQTEPADVDIYESDGIDSLEIIEDIVRPQVIRSGDVTLTGLNLLVPEGRWVNAVTTDANIRLTIMFYRVPQELV